MSRPNRLNDLTSVVLGSSRSSFVNTICKFVRDVDEMNDTVLVPTMLTVLNDDRSSSSTPSSEPFDLQTLYQLLNRLKEELTIARFDDGKKGAKNVNSANILSAINCNNNSADNNNLNNHQQNNQISNNNINNNNNTNSSNNQINVPSLRIPEGADLPMSKKSCKCSDSDDGFSSLNSYSRNSDEESTIGSESECCHLLLSSSASTSQQPRLELLNGAESSNLNSVESSSPEYIVNLLRLHIQGIQSILTRFSKCADKVSESYVDNTLN